MKASVMDLRHNMKKILEAVDRNETVTLLYHGKARAQIVPLASKKEATDKLDEHPFCGMWADREDMEDVQDYVRKLREPRHRGL